MPTILFLCPHNAAKGILAAAYCNHRAQQAGLAVLADSAGTDPADQIWPSVLDLLHQEGIAPPARPPRPVTAADLRAAAAVISMGCPVAELPGVPQAFTLWEDVPLASTDLPAAWTAIRGHVDALLAELARAPA